MQESDFKKHLKWQIFDSAPMCLHNAGIILIMGPANERSKLCSDDPSHWWSPYPEWSLKMRLKENGCHLAENIFKFNFLNENHWIFTQLSRFCSRLWKTIIGSDNGLAQQATSHYRNQRWPFHQHRLITVKYQSKCNDFPGIPKSMRHIPIKTLRDSSANNYRRILKFSMKKNKNTKTSVIWPRHDLNLTPLAAFLFFAECSARQKIKWINKRCQI